jgi:hypothetical protein
MRISERSDRVEPLLVRHDKKYVRPGQWHFLEAPVQAHELPARI